MDEQGFNNWLETLGRGLETRDAEALAATFSEDAVFYDTPFQAPQRGRLEIQMAFEKEASERKGVFFYHEIIGYEDMIGWAAWANTFTRAGTDDPVRMEGILKAVFDEAGYCTEMRQWWHVMEPGQGDLMRDFDA